jgi:hypothetical protein
MKKLLLLSLTLTSSIALASELNVPNQFEDGQVTSAAQMNANFDAIQAAVNDNHARNESRFSGVFNGIYEWRTRPYRHATGLS